MSADDHPLGVSAQPDPQKIDLLGEVESQTRSNQQQVDILHFAPNELLLAVRHNPSWLGGADRTAADFTELPAVSELPGLALTHITAPPVTVSVIDGRELTFFQVHWNDGDSLGARLRAIWTFLASFGDSLDVSENSDMSAVLFKATPNWYMGAAIHKGGIGTHGPGRPPRRIQPEGRRVDTPPANFIEKSNNAPVVQGTGREVDVYILDTVPPFERLRNAWDEWNGEDSFKQYREIAEPLSLWPAIMPTDPYMTERALYSYAGNNAFVDLHSPVLLDQHHGSAAAHTGHESHTDDDFEPYELADHGFFIAGIVHRLAKEACLFIIQAINDYGVGTFLSFAEAFGKVAVLRASRQRDAIINCSFTFAFGDSENDKYDLYPHGDRAELFRDGKLPESNLDPVDEAKKAAVDLLKAIVAGVQPLDSGRNAVIVACTGNDSKAQEPRLPVRYPAALGTTPDLVERVVAVGALKSVATPPEIASYSNETPPNGLLAFGGDYAEPPNHGIVSVYSKATIGDDANTHGIAEWAGTSFAAAVVSGRIAALCREKDKDPVAILDELRLTATAGQPAVIDVALTPISSP